MKVHTGSEIIGRMKSADPGKGLDVPCTYTLTGKPATMHKNSKQTARAISSREKSIYILN